MKKKVILISQVLVLIFFISIVLSLATQGVSHNANNIWISPTATMQNFVDTNIELIQNNQNFNVANLGSYPSVSFGHNANEIIVKVNGNEKTLLQALQTGKTGLCGIATDSLSGVTLNFGHSAEDIKINIGETDSISLQDAIIQGKFCCQPNCGTRKCGAVPNGCTRLYSNCGSCPPSLPECSNGYCGLYSHYLEFWKISWNSISPRNSLNAAMEACEKVKQYYNSPLLTTCKKISNVEVSLTNGKNDMIDCILFGKTAAIEWRTDDKKVYICPTPSGSHTNIYTWY